MITITELAKELLAAEARIRECNHKINSALLRMLQEQETMREWIHIREEAEARLSSLLRKVGQ